MRIHIRHESAHLFEPPVRFLNAALRVTPRSHESQHVVRWRVEIDGDSRIRACDDGFGNCMHTLSVTGPASSLRILAEGVVDTFDAAGIVRATVERFPPELFLRDTALTQPDERRREIARGLPAGNTIERLHALLMGVGEPREDERPAPQTGPGAQRQSQSAKAPAGGAFARASALAHDFIACARLVGAPARFVSGYYLDPKGEAAGAHVWAEAFADGVGWIGFDPAHQICPHESHVRMAVGLDALDAACVRAAPAPLSVTERVDVRRHG